jgi:hypothetical protein
MPKISLNRQASKSHKFSVRSLRTLKTPFNVARSLKKVQMLGSKPAQNTQSISDLPEDSKEVLPTVEPVLRYRTKTGEYV